MSGPQPISVNYFETDAGPGKTPDLKIHLFDANTGKVIHTIHIPPRDLPAPPSST